MMNRTEKSTANSRQKSTANSRQDKSRANSRQGKPKGCDRDKAKYEANYEEKHSTEESCSQPVPKRLRTDADVQEEQWELKLDDVIRPSQRSISTRKSRSTKRSSRQLRNSDTEKSIWIDKKLTRSCIQQSSGPRTRSRMSSTVKVGAT